MAIPEVSKVKDIPSSGQSANPVSNETTEDVLNRVSFFNAAKTLRPVSTLEHPIYAKDIDKVHDSREVKETVSKVARSEADIRALIDDEVIAVAKKYGLEISKDTELNISELDDLFEGHMKEACDFATNVYDNLPADLKERVSLKDLQLASMLHDYGKVLIPAEILNKPGRLDFDERTKMNAHAELGELLLRKQGIVSDSVLEVVKHHHRSKAGGYPDDGEKASFTSQVLCASDVMSALLEERSYKPPYTRRFALEIMHKQVEENRIDPDVYKVFEKLAPTMPEAVFAHDGPDEPKNYKPIIWKSIVNGYRFEYDIRSGSFVLKKV